LGGAPCSHMGGVGKDCGSAHCERNKHPPHPTPPPASVAQRPKLTGRRFAVRSAPGWREAALCGCTCVRLHGTPRCTAERVCDGDACAARGLGGFRASTRRVDTAVCHQGSGDNTRVCVDGWSPLYAVHTTLKPKPDRPWPVDTRPPDPSSSSLQPRHDKRSHRYHSRGAACAASFRRPRAAMVVNVTGNRCCLGHKRSPSVQRSPLTCWVRTEWPG
jgi:hypothetical protein